MYIKPINLCVNNTPSDCYATVSKNPVFSWSIEQENYDKIQAQWKICVRDGDKLLWDSDWQLGEETHAEYAGNELIAGMRIKWSLQVRNSAGEESEAVYARFVVVPEVLGEKWITKAENAPSETIYLAKPFDCANEIERATLYISGIGYQSVSINGKKPDDAVLQPAVTNFNDRCYFITLSVEDYLNKGENVIGVKLGDGWRRNFGHYLDTMEQHRPVEFFGKPQLTARLDIKYTDGTTDRITTDEDWYVLKGGTVKNHLFDGEIYDASQEKDGWDMPGFDYSSMEKAVLAEKVGDAVAQEIEPIKIQKRIRPISKTMQSPGEYIFDFGVNIAGYVQIRVPEGMKRGDKISLQFSEELREEGGLNMDYMREAKSVDEYISNGADGDTLWSPDFVYHGFRYMRMTGWRGIPDFDDVTAFLIYSDVDNESFFRCGSAIVNKIQEAIVQTERDNIQGIATDCPQRDERLGWMNDATVRFEETPYNFNVARLFPKIVRDIVAEQIETGAITCTAPYIAGNRPSDPVCSSFLIAGWQSWLHYGNKKVLADNYEHYKAWNECIKSFCVDGITRYYFYGDWAGTSDSCISEENPKSAVTPPELMGTGYHYYNYCMLAKIAKVLDMPEEEALNLKAAEEVKEVFLKTWWNEDTGVVATGSQGCQAFALWLGILPEECRRKAAEVLHRAVADIGYRIKAGNLTNRYVMDMLADYGYIEDAWKIITREEYPSYGYMIQNGATTIWERFEQKKDCSMNSHNHPMYGAVGSWFYSRLAGLIPTDAGWSRFTVKPVIPKDLLHTHSRIDTVRGAVEIKWIKRYNNLYVEVSVPYGSVADYEIMGDKKVLSPGNYHFCYGI